MRPSGSVPPAAAIANATYDATGVWITELPMTAERVLTALRHKTNRWLIPQGSFLKNRPLDPRKTLDGRAMLGLLAVWVDPLIAGLSARNLEGLQRNEKKVRGCCASRTEPPRIPLVSPSPARTPLPSPPGSVNPPPYLRLHRKNLSRMRHGPHRS